MRKSLLIGLIVVVLALGSIGAAFAGVLGFSHVGFLAMGVADMGTINVDKVGWCLCTGVDKPVEVHGVNLSFDRTVPVGTTIIISLREDTNEDEKYDPNDKELAYYAAAPTAADIPDGDFTLFTLYDASNVLGDCSKPSDCTGDFPNPAQVRWLKVTVAGHSTYVTT